MRALLDGIDWLARAAAVAAAACLALLALVILAEVCSIWIFNKSLEFSWEYGAFLMAGAFFLGLGWTLDQEGHVRVGILTEYLPPKASRYLDIIATLTGLAIATFLCVSLAGLTYSSYVDGSKTFTASATPLVIPQAMITFGAFILALKLFARVVNRIGAPGDDKLAFRQQEQ